MCSFLHIKLSQKRGQFTKISYCIRNINSAYVVVYFALEQTEKFSVRQKLANEISFFTHVINGVEQAKEPLVEGMNGNGFSFQSTKFLGREGMKIATYEVGAVASKRTPLSSGVIGLLVN